MTGVAQGSASASAASAVCTESASKHAQESAVYGPERKTKAKLALKTFTPMTSCLLFLNKVSLLCGLYREETQFKD